MNDSNATPHRPGRPQSAGAPLHKPAPFDMAAHREQFGKVWGAEAKRASARLRKARGQMSPPVAETIEQPPAPEPPPEPPPEPEPNPEPEPTPEPDEPEPEPTPEPEAEPTPEPEARCEAETVVGGTRYRCALEVGHDDDHRFQTVEDAEPSSGGGQDAVDKAIPKLENEAKRHAGRVREIMGEDANQLVVCELCLPMIPGYRWDSAPDEPTTQRVREAIGLPSLDNFRPSATERKCDDCDGLGKVRTGSLVQGKESIRCDPCDGKGYVGTRERVNTLPEPEPLAAAANGATVYPDDGVKRDMFGTPETDPDYGKMPNMRERPVDYWQTHREQRVNVQITHVIVHTPEQVREIVREAAAIADEETTDVVAREMIFRESCRLLGQRYTFPVMPQAVPMPLGPPFDIRARHQPAMTR